MAAGVPSASGLKANDVLVAVAARERDDEGFPEKGPRRGGAKAAKAAARTRAARKRPEAGGQEQGAPGPATPRDPFAPRDLSVSDPDAYMADLAKRLAARSAAPDDT
jgi:putative transposase